LNKVLKLILKIILGGYLLFSIWFYFQRYNNLPLDGDIPAIVLPVPSYMPVMKDPFGLNVLFHDSVYAATNRYFTHLTMTAFFKNVPLWLQSFSTPIDSVYYSCAFVRVFTQFFLIFLIAYFATGKLKFWHLDFLIAATICVPLFQTYGFYTWMAIVDASVTYTFFYSLALSFVLLYFMPFFNAAMGRRDFNFSLPKKIFLVLLAVFISFNGPLNSPVILLTCAALLLQSFLRNYIQLKSLTFGKRFITSIRTIPSTLLGMFTIVILVNLYSFYIGRNNIENFWVSVPLAERYARLPDGFWFHYTFKLAQPMLIGMVVVNCIIIYFLKPDAQTKKVMIALRWFTILSALYILMLPLGGYRVYRSNIVRFDTIMPITVGFMMFYAYTSVYIFYHLRKVYKLVLYSVLVIVIGAAYVNADWGIQKNNSCERRALEIIANSSDRIVFVDLPCSIMNWEAMKNPGDSKSKAAMLYYWNIIDEQKQYYQK
jgi:hypothetical protein